MTPEMVQHTLVLQMQLKQVTDRLATVVQDALQREQDPDRSPSPPPRYDGNGKRTNTREIRMREALNSERSRIIENLIKINPLYQVWVIFVRLSNQTNLCLCCHFSRLQISSDRSLSESFTFLSRSTLTIILSV
jgi:hypothetical protein